MKLSTPTRRKINTELAAISRQYHDAIPLESIFEALSKEGVQALQEDGEPWQGFLFGDDSFTTFPLNASNSVLFLSWYKLTSGRWEINAYLS